jgi:hypothetical protein
MTRKTSSICTVAVCALLSLAASSLPAATIIKLNLGGIGPDVGMNAGGILSTENDGNAGTLGDQNTDVEFVGFLDGSNPDITTTDASFTLSGLTAAPGPANSFPPLMIQNFTGGTLTLYAPNNSILLTGTLTNSALTGVTGPPGTGALFTTTFGTITGGSLSGGGILPGSLTLSMNLSNVNGGGGFVLNGNNFLQPFLADASVNISADVPEPAALTLVLFGLAAAACGRRRR